MPTHGGDDFDDDFVPDDTVALSDGAADEGVSISADEGEFLGVSPDLADEDAGAPAVSVPINAQGAKEVSKKRKRREKEKQNRAKKKRLTESLEMAEPPSKAAQPPDLLVEYLAKLQAKTFSDHSAVELHDLHIPASAIVDTTAWSAPRSLDHLGDFIAKVVPTLKIRLAQKSKENGAPTLIYIAGNALRVADVCRVLKQRSIRGEKGGDVAKLFAKHIKLEEHVAYLKRTRVGAAVGTPGRVGKLLCETDALSVSALTHIILDVSFQDAKKRSMMDMAETRDELFQTVLGADAIQEGLRNGKIQLVLF